MKSLEKQTYTLKSSIKILSELTSQDLQLSVNKSVSDADEYHSYFNWDSWSFVSKKIAKEHI